MKSTKLALLKHIEQLQTNGQYWFVRSKVIKNLNLTKIAFKMAAYRLQKLQKICSLGKGFYLIIPLEYRRTGTPPPYWYLDPFMQFLQVDYYIGLLTAAAYHGSSHQVSQQFQVMVNPPVVLGKTKKTNLICFTKKNLSITPVEDLKVTTGLVKISTKEATMLDLVQYYKAAGHLGLVATILSELAPNIEPSRLSAAAKQGKYELATIQRLGFLLDQLGFKKKTTELLILLQQEWQSKQHKKLILLVPKPQISNKPLAKDSKWRILINEKIEVDEV